MHRIKRGGVMHTVVAAIVVVIISVFAAKADPEQCREAIRNYNSARAEVSDALRLYANCISSSRGRDDCSTEFSSLQSAQEEFESGVSEYESECP
jgi:hypothetical protein